MPKSNMRIDQISIFARRDGKTDDLGVGAGER